MKKSKHTHPLVPLAWNSEMLNKNAEITRLRKLLDYAGEVASKNTDTILSLNDANDKLLSEIESLRAMLRNGCDPDVVIKNMRDAELYRFIRDKLWNNKGELHIQDMLFLRQDYKPEDIDWTIRTAMENTHAT